MAWDTNVLLDFFEHGRALWDGVPLGSVPPDYEEELHGLHTLIDQWMLRDIRFLLLERTLSDARGELRRDRYEQRVRAFDEFASILALGDGWGTSVARTGVTTAAGESALSTVPEGADRDLVAESLDAGAHVFLTRDHRVLAAVDSLGELGLWVATPLDLLSELAAEDELLLGVGEVTWPVPDLARASRLMAALPPATALA